MTEGKSVQKSRNLLAWMAVICGGALLLSGVAAAIGYLGLPQLLPGDDLLAPQLGQVAAMFVGLVCGTLLVVHGSNSLRARPSRPLRLPPVPGLIIAFALVLGLGNVLLTHGAAQAYIFPLVFFLERHFPL